MIEREYFCDDGTVLPVRFADERQAAQTWRLDRSHGRDPRTPLGDALDRAGVEGGRRAYDEVGLLFPPSWEPPPDACGLSYWSEAPISPERLGRMVEGCGVLVQRHGSALGIWHDFCMPRSIDSWEQLEAAGDADAHGAGRGAGLRVPPDDDPGVRLRQRHQPVGDRPRAAVRR